jgi:hypothetical protein
LQAKGCLSSEQALDYLQELCGKAGGGDASASMIHLDTNYLVGLLIKGSLQAIEVDG